MSRSFGWMKRQRVFNTTSTDIDLLIKAFADIGITMIEESTPSIPTRYRLYGAHVFLGYIEVGSDVCYKENPDVAIPVRYMIEDIINDCIKKG
jgi:hypothetical protein